MDELDRSVVNISVENKTLLIKLFDNEIFDL